MRTYLRLGADGAVFLRNRLIGRSTNEFRATSVFHMGWENGGNITLWSRDPKITLTPFGDTIQNNPRARLIAKVPAKRLRGTAVHKALARHLTVQVGHGHATVNVDLRTLEPLPETAPAVDEQYLSDDDLDGLHVRTAARHAAPHPVY